MSNHMRRMGLRLLFCLGGILLTSLSAAIFYQTGLGSDPFQVFCVALHQRLGLSYGLMITVLNGAAALLLLAFFRKYFKVALLAFTLFFGPMVDLYGGPLSAVVRPDSPFALRLALGLLGCLCLSAGVYLYLITDLGASPSDAVGLVAADLTGIGYDRIRIGMDLLFTAAGFFLGGTVGIVTLASMLTTGPVVGLLGRRFNHGALVRYLSGGAQGGILNIGAK